MRFVQLPFFFLLFTLNLADLYGQCISSPTVTDRGCDSPPFQICATIPPFLQSQASSITWTNGATGQCFTYTPDCGNLGPESFTPCWPTGTNVPAQTFNIPNFTGSIAPGQTTCLTLNVSGICYQDGIGFNCAGLPLNLGGGGNVDICVNPPNAAPLCLSALPVDQVPSSLPCSVLPSGDPNGTWEICLTPTNNLSYNIGPASVNVPAFSSSSFICAPTPANFYIFGGCPSFVGIQASTTQACSGQTITLSANLNPAGAPNVSYQWNEVGGAFTSTSATPQIALSNTTCAPVTRTFRLQTLNCTNNGSALINQPQTIAVTIYPEINPNSIQVDNTTNITDPGCKIIVTVPCPNFTVNGLTSATGVFEIPSLPGDNGSLAEIITSNGNAACNVTRNIPVTCQGNCNPPAYTTSVVSLGNQYSVQVTILSLGDATSYTIEPSLGNGLTFSAPGNYTFGPYPECESVSIKIFNDIDPNCNVNLGLFNDCKNCPELLTATISGAANRCAGETVSLAATVSAGAVLNTDYRIQWYVNGAPISGASTLNYTHTLQSGDYCAAVAQTYSAVITCINGGSSTATTLNTSAVNVYNRPRFGIEFQTEQCSATLVSNCGNSLTLNNGGAVAPTAGTTVTINYSASITGAPASCVTTGSALVGCNACATDPGDGTAEPQVVCWGQDFTIANAGALTIQPGFVVGVAVSRQPITNVTSTANLLAQADVAVLGPYNSPGSINPVLELTNNGIDVPTPNNPCGEVFYFTPFASMQAEAGQKINQSGIITNTAPSQGPFCDGATPIPGIGLLNITAANLPYCQGLTTYNLELCVNNDDGYTIDPLTDNVLGQAVPGGITSDFPAFNNQHNSTTPTGPTPTCYLQPGYGGTAGQDPNGKTINITTIIVALTPFACNEFGDVSWSFKATLNESINFPTICPACNSVGKSIAVTLLPQNTIPNITNPAPICAGESLDLNTLNPTSPTGTTGQFQWYQGTPTSGTPLTSTLVAPTTNTQYCVEYAFCQTQSCVSNTRCVQLQTLLTPTISTPTTAPICPGESVNLTAFNSQVTTQLGTFEWYIGNPDASPPGALLNDPSNVTPIGSERYYVKFTSASGCSSTTYIAFSYNAPPTLLASAPQACQGVPTDLTLNEPILTNAVGTFAWYTDSPSNGGVLLFENTQGQILVTPSDGQTYYVRFTAATTGCSTITTVTYNVNPLPVLSVPSPTAVCAGASVNLTALQSQITTQSGTFQWYSGNPTSGGTLIGTPSSFAPTSTPLYVVFTESGTDACSNTISFTHPLNTAPTISANAPQQVKQCADAPQFSLIPLQTQIASGAGLSFVWYNGNPASGGTLLDINSPVPQNNPSTQLLNVGQTATYYVVITNAGNCSSTHSITYQKYQPLAGATATYNCATGLSVNLSAITGGSGAGYHVVSNSPNQNGNILAHNAAWTVLIEDNFGCDHIALTGTVDCPLCEAGAAVAPSDALICCGESATFTNPSAQISETNRQTIAWGLTPFAEGPIINAAQAYAAADDNRVFESNGGSFNFTYNHECALGESDIAPGQYYVTPFISKVKPQEGPPVPIIFDPANGCTPQGQLCFTISGTGWAIDSLYLLLPNGNLIDVVATLTEALTGTPLVGVTITQALLNSFPLPDIDGDGNNDLPCIDLTTFYDGNPNGDWTIIIRNVGTGALNFEMADSEVVVSAATCSLITEDQISFIAGISGVVAPGQTETLTITMPSPQIQAPVITYDPANGCTPVGFLQPVLSSNATWVIQPLLIDFPDPNPPVNVIQQFLGADLAVTQGLLDGVALLSDLNGDGHNDLPPIPLDTLYNGNPNGTWSIYVNNTGTGPLSFTLPSFDITVSAATCAALNGVDEVSTVDGITVVIPGGTDTTIFIQVPSIPSGFPTISDDCTDFGTPAVLTVLDDMRYQNATATCLNQDAHQYQITVTGLNGGAPGIVPGANYIFPSPATNQGNGTYTFTATIFSFPYNFNITNNIGGGTGSAGCNFVQASITADPCICTNPTVSFLSGCLQGDENNFTVLVNLSQLGSSQSYTITDNFANTQPQTGITQTGIYQYGVYPNGTSVTVTLVSDDDADCNRSSTPIVTSGTCGDCSPGLLSPLANNILCKDETAHINATGTLINVSGNIVAYALAPQPITNTTQLSNAVLTVPANPDNSLDLTNSGGIAPGAYYLTPFIALQPGAPDTLAIPYGGTDNCSPDALITPIVNLDANWIIDPFLITLPNGQVKNIFDVFGIAPLDITPNLWPVLEQQNLLPLPLSLLYNGNPNGRWCITLTNTGTGALVFSLKGATENEDIVVMDTCNSGITAYPLPDGNGSIENTTVAPGATVSVCFDVYDEIVIPGFPEIDAECDSFGTAIPLVVTAPIDFDLSANCYDQNGDGLEESYRISICNITGGPVGLVNGATYSIPSGYISAGGGCYVRTIPVANAPTSATVEVGALASGSASCSASKSIDLPTPCITSCEPTALFGTTCLPGQSGFYVNANISSFGALNSSVRISNNQNSATQIVSTTGVTQIGPFTDNSSVTVTVTGVQNNICITSSNPLTGACIVCEAGVAAIINGDAVLCEGDALTVNTNGAVGLDDGEHIIAWAIAPTAFTSAADTLDLVTVLPGNLDGSFTLENDGNIAPGTYQLTPFLANSLGGGVPQEICPQIPYDPAAGCVPDGEIMPNILGTGWTVTNFSITFPDGSNRSVYEIFGLPQIPITSALWASVPALGVLPLQLTEVYTGNPNGTWTLNVNNTGTSPLQFEILGFNVIVTCDGETESYPVDGTGLVTVPAGTIDPISISFEINGGDCYTPLPVDVVCPEIPYEPAAGCIPNGDIMPVINGANWVVNNFILTFPDGSTKTIFEIFGLPPLAITPVLWQTVQGLGVLPLSLTELYTGNPTGTWGLTVNNSGTGDLQFEIPDFEISVTCNGETQTFPVQGTGVVTVPAGSSPITIEFEIEGSPCVIPGFPEYDPLCQDWGTPTAITITNDIDYNLSTQCQDTNNDGIDDQIAVTISNLTGGAPQVVAGSSYTFNSTPVANFVAGAGAYTAILPTNTSGNISVTVGSTTSGDCANTQTAALPSCQLCPLSAGDVTFTAICQTAGDNFFVDVNILQSAGSGTIAIRNGNTTLQTVTVTGTQNISVVVGPFTNSVTLSAVNTGITGCSLSSGLLFRDCTNQSCQVGTTQFGNNKLCCNQTINVTMSASSTFLNDGYTIAYAFGDAAITSAAGLADANISLPDANNGYSFTNECDMDAGLYYITPFIAELPNASSINEECSDFGNAIPVYLLDDITYQNVSAVCTDEDANIYTVTVEGLSGGAPGIVAGATYTFPSQAVANGNGSYSFDVVLGNNTFPYNFTIGSTGGANCTVQASIQNQPPCAGDQVPPVALPIELGIIHDDLNIDITDYVSDANGDVITIVGISPLVTDGGNFAIDGNIISFEVLQGVQGAVPVTVTYTITDGNTQVSNTITFFVQGPTPVSLLSFMGEVLDEGNRLKWTTASETNNDYFTLQRSTDGSNFTNLNKIDGAGTSSMANSYAYTDRNAPTGLAYYRLMQTDFDGTTRQAGQVITLRRNMIGLGIVQIVPVPTKNVVTVHFEASQTSDLFVQLHDATGRVIKTQTLIAQTGSNAFNIDLSSYAAGIYFVTLRNNTDWATGRIVKE